MSEALGPRNEFGWAVQTAELVSWEEEDFVDVRVFIEQGRPFGINQPMDLGVRPLAPQGGDCG